MRDLQGDVYARFPPPCETIRPNDFIHRISPREVVLQIAALFKGYPDLAREFNVFLPPGYSLQPEGEGKSQLYFVEQT